MDERYFDPPSRLFGLDELARIGHILISHSHLDHVPATLEALRTPIFNGVIWPCFTRLPSAERPILAFEPFAIRDVLTFRERRIEVLPAVHTVPAVGFAVLADAGAWAFTGDTGPNAALAVHITHIKPGEVESVMAQIEALGSRHRIAALASDQLMLFGSL